MQPCNLPISGGKLGCMGLRRAEPACWGLLCSCSLLRIVCCVRSCLTVRRLQCCARRLLIYTPYHPFIVEALKGIADEVIRTYEAHKWKDTTALTGPITFNKFGVHPVFKRNGCSIVNKTAVADGLHLARENDLCPETQNPEPTGIVQVRPSGPPPGVASNQWPHNQGIAYSRVSFACAHALAAAFAVHLLIEVLHGMMSSLPRALPVATLAVICGCP